MGTPLIGDVIEAVTNIGGKIADKIWMDKEAQAQLSFDKEKFSQEIGLAVKKLAQDGNLAELEAVFKEAQAQRDFVLKQFGSAETLKGFVIGRIILLGRASIRWIIVGWAAYMANKVIKMILTDKVILALAGGTLSGSMAWVVTLIVICILGIPLSYVTGVSIEKLLKSRGVI